MLTSTIQALLQADFDWQLADNPCFASQAGFHAHDARLQDLTPAAFAARREHNDEVLAAATRLKEKEEETGAGAEAMAPRDREQLDLLIHSVEEENKGFVLGCHLYPVNSIGYGGVHNNFVEALDWLGEDGRHENFLSRFEAFPKQVEDYKELLRHGIKVGKAPSKDMMRKIPSQLGDLLAELDHVVVPPPLETLDGAEVLCQLCAPTGSAEVGCKLCAAASSDDGAKATNSPGPIGVRLAALPPALGARGAKAKVAFRAAIADLRRFFAKEVAPKARPVSGCLGLPRGKEVYAQCLRYHTTTDMSAEEIHAEGLAQVARIEKRFVTDVLEVVGFQGSFAEFVEQLRAPESGHFATTREELLGRYRNLVAKITALLPHFFEALPKSTLEVVAKDAESAPAAYYMQGTSDGSRPGRFYVNVSHLSKRPVYEMVALALHEGVPGHHLQGSLAIENKSLPPMLRFIEDRRYEYCPARRQLYAAYLEGWALYCEALGEEMGMFDVPPSQSASASASPSQASSSSAAAAPPLGAEHGGPLALFGRLSMEMMRAVRLVVDTGIHDKGWSVPRCVKYMMDKTGMHRHECEAECYRYEAWPGQACAYKIGEIAIWKMRREAEAALGPAGLFDLRRFHSVLLGSGPLPLSLLAAKVKAWVRGELKTTRQEETEC